MLKLTQHLINLLEGKPFLNVTRGQGRRLVIPDIHGCPNTLQELVEKVGLTKDDQLFFLGDYIDRGLDSKGVLDYLETLYIKGYQIFPIRGNHEQMLLDAQKSNRTSLETHAKQERLMPLLTPDKQIIASYQNFIEVLPYYYDLGDFLLVHAGFNFKAPNPFEDYNEMIWIRNFQPDKDWVGNKIIIHGHTPVHKAVIMEAIHNRYPVIPLDNGCVFSHGNYSSEQGNLLCLDLDTFELTAQPNINDLVR